MYVYKNIFCDPSLEPSCQDGSNEGSQYVFSLRNKKKYLYPQYLYPLLSGALSTVSISGLTRAILIP